MENNGRSYNVIDTPLSSYHVTKFELCNFVFSIILHCVDVGFDIYVAYSYFASSNYSYGAWSVALILLPSIVLTSISVKMYLNDMLGNEIKFANPLRRVILCILGLPIQSGTLIRIVDSLYFASKSLKAEKKKNGTELKKEYFKKMLEENSDASLLKVFEAYLESAPQQVLQIILLVVETSQGFYVHSLRQILSIVFGFLSMSLCMVNYNRSIRLDQENKLNVTVSGLIVQFFWHLLLTVSRILSISAVASLYPFWTCVAIGIHWFIFSIWLVFSREHNFCLSKLLNVLFDFSVGAVYIFNFLSVKDHKKKYYYLVFYLILFLENTIAIVIWVLKFSFVNWVYYFFAIVPHVCFLLGLMFMIVYYKYLHPNLTNLNTTVDGNMQERTVSVQSTRQERIRFLW